jgi:RNA polymerase sigma-70 factor (ECF subfamily)
MCMEITTLAAPVVQPARDARFCELLERYRAPVARLVGAYEPNRADREDLLQDIWLGLWRALPAFRGDCSERTFVYRVAHNRAIAHLGRRRFGHTDLEAARELPHPAPPADVVLDAGQRHTLLVTALRQLPLIQREVVMLSLEGLPHREIAQVLGITENNVSVRLTRARTELARRLRPRDAFRRTP